MGDAVGTSVGLGVVAEGLEVLPVGAADVGALVGILVGTLVGSLLVSIVGILLGCFVGILVGS